MKSCSKLYIAANTLIILTFPNFVTGQSFTKITTGPVVNSPGDSRSVNWVDVNNDGYTDLMVTNGPAGGQDNFVYINDGNGGFTSLQNDTIINDNAPSDGATFADTDNDGDVDCYVANWYATPNLFYTNNGTGSFTRITGPVTTSGGYCETASWGDYDNDGLVDLYVTNSAGVNKNLLFHNDGGNSFTKITTGDIVNDITSSRSVNWTDMDSDGDIDLFVTNESNQNCNIYRNDNGLFTKITTGVLVTTPGNAMSSSWGDIDNDGDLDVFIARDGTTNSLYRNDGNFNFTLLDTDTVSTTGAHSFGSAWSDTDNDGDLDLFVTNAFSTPLKQLNFLYSNDGNGNFTRINSTAPATDSSWSYGCAFGDYDNDGFEDLVVATVRFGNIDQNDFLYHNDGNSNNWITIKLAGTTTNRSAIGTKVRIKSIINGNVTWQMREISTQSGYCGQNDMRAHFGLGNGVIVDSIIVEWYGNSPEVYINTAANQFITITQGQGITGFNEKDSPHLFSLFPNPAFATLNIRYHSIHANRALKYEITNSKGIVVDADIIKKETINISKLSAGNYILKLIFEKEIGYRKFVKM